MEASDDISINNSDKFSDTEVEDQEDDDDIDAVSEEKSITEENDNDDDDDDGDNAFVEDLDDEFLEDDQEDDSSDISINDKSSSTAEEKLVANDTPIDIYEDDIHFQKKYYNELVDKIRSEHTEFIIHNSEEVETRTMVIRDSSGRVVDDLHKTMPFLTKFEKATIIGMRTQHLNDGIKPLVKTTQHMSNFDIAELELRHRLVPFIVRRPLPDGKMEYWNIADLEIL